MGSNDRELEAKFYLQDKDKLEERLKTLGADSVHGRVLETNLRFDTPDGVLGRTHQVLRLRKDTRVWLTYKSASEVQDGVFNRQEIEFEISDFEAGQGFLAALGYQVSVIYEKFRTTYSLDGLEVVIDELPYGDFLEIEGDEPQAIRACAASLGLDWSAVLQQSYLGLFTVLREKMGFNFRDLTFENFRMLQVGIDQLGIRPADQD